MTAGAITDTVPFKPEFQPTGVLTNHDVTGMTFYIAQNMMLAFAVFFFVQVSLVPKVWRTSVCTAGLVTGVAWYNYTRMSQTWVDTYSSPTTFRYTDWLVTVPLQICEFFFILKACGPVRSGLGMQMFLASIVMVAAGWVAEIDIASKMGGFVVGMICWLYIVYQVSAGEAYEMSKNLTGASANAFASIRTIVAIGWTIYPIGFALAYLCYFDQPAGNLSNSMMAALNIIYNLADLINKGAFGMAVWQAAASDKSEMTKY
jgi:bacteriorhodopsin